MPGRAQCEVPTPSFNYIPRPRSSDLSCNCALWYPARPALANSVEPFAVSFVSMVVTVCLPLIGGQEDLVCATCSPTFNSAFVSSSATLAFPSLPSSYSLWVSAQTRRFFLWSTPFCSGRFPTRIPLASCRFGTSLQLGAFRELVCSLSHRQTTSTGGA